LIEDFLTRLEEARTVDSIRSTYLEFCESLGFSDALVWFLRQGHDPDFVTSLPDWWHGYYVEVGMAEHDYLNHHCQNSLSTFRYNFEADPDRYTLDRVATEVISEARHNFDMRTGLAIPVHSVDRSWSGGINIGTSMKEEERDRVLHEHLDSIHLASVLTHYRLQEIYAEEKRRKISLSVREKEVLLWLSKGLSTARIADRLGIADVTVTMHLTNARRKLDARTREQALAKAIVLKLIEI
jgi:LuxR family quorum-sensing system transcriptional regulator CciR